MKTMVPFFSDEIRVRVSASDASGNVGQEITLRDYWPGMPLALYRLDNGEILAERRDFLNRYRGFIRGEEVPS